MSFDKELKVVMVSSLGLLAYLLVASAAMMAIHMYFGITPFRVAWLVVLIIPLNFAVCSMVCIAFYKRKERNFKKIKEQLTELSDLTTFEYDKKFDYDKKREEKTPPRAKASSE